MIGKRVRFFVSTSLIARWGTIEEVRGKNARIDGDWFWLPNITFVAE